MHRQWNQIVIIPYDQFQFIYTWSTITFKYSLLKPNTTKMTTSIVWL